MEAARPQALRGEPGPEETGCWCSWVVEQLSDRFHERVSAVEQRLTRWEGMVLADRGLLGAMSLRLCRIGEDVGELRLDLAELRRSLGRLAERRPWRL
ncbi:hypothetical protein [Kitasatospora sp. GP82]|uniref:hypothetical protein n=1 Tax=Kitasatospora sp. GP82 TaxID=3035089 RepID=UPI002475187B|nr:hypothetical protein [Kitasatospora sp. GP82]MDH6127639.1 hypothetical protein [Kitasatospora sp. GP82]